MIIKNFFLLLALICTQSLFANHTTEWNPTAPLAPGSDWSGCDLLPPNTLNIENVGIGWVQLSWTPVPGASQYRIQVVDDNSGNILSTTFVPSSTLAAQVSTQGSTGTCHAKIWSVCSNGTWNPDLFFTSLTIDTIILELVANGYSFPSIPVLDCSVGTGLSGSCSFSWDATETPFRVQYLKNGLLFVRDFTITGKVKPGVRYAYFHKNQDDLGQNLTFYVTGMVGNQKFVIKYKNSNGAETTLAELGVVLTATGGGALYKFEGSNSNCTIEKMKQGAGFSGATDRMSASDDATQKSLDQRVLSAHPNPFSDQLTVKLHPTTEQNPVTLALYDLMGTEKYRVTTSGDQNEVSLITTDLQQGVYLLQVASEGKRETMKVLKTR